MTPTFDLRDAVADTLTTDLIATLTAMPLAQRIEALNRVRRRLHESGPFSNEPVDLVQWVHADNVIPNEYNPNAVAPPEMRLLKLSIEADGYTQPIVGMPDDEGVMRVVDGAHRTRVGKEVPSIRMRIHHHVPVVEIRRGQRSIADRMASTIRHNRARGKHGVRPMADIVAALREGWDDAKIMRELGMDADEVLRFRQVRMPETFKDRPFSPSWEG